MPEPDTIEIRRLKIRTHIGVPDEEQSEAQTLCITVKMVPTHGFDALSDDITHTIDYAAVAQQIEDLAAAKPRRLIETLALETADFLLAKHPLRKVAVTLEKQILPNTDCVAVHLERSR